LHGAIWILLFVFFYVGEVRLSHSFAVWDSLMVVVSQAILFYSNRYWYAHAGTSRVSYRVKSITLLILLTMFNLLVEYCLQIRQHYGIGETTDDWYTLFSVVIFVAFNMCAYLASELYIYQRKAQAHRLQIRQLKEEKTTSELELLRARINPHFLFNALNTIYALSYLKDVRTPEKIMLLSELLRYALYDCRAESIPLKREIDYLKTYIDFNRLREDDLQQVTFESDEEFGTATIAPMILVSFVENAYKHSRIQYEEDGYIRIAATCDGGVFHFSVENSVPEAVKEVEPQPVRSSGIGLENIQKQLKILYRKGYSLEIIPAARTFRVEFTLNLNSHE
jgi:sensor histidine kinase YesM